ncbi:MAG TPA: hypothetical protein VF221_18170 [Chloroflexota bacterium]
MRRFAGIIALLLLFSGAAPVLACVATSAMRHEESACCRAMHGHCDGMTEMGCCRTEVRTDTAPQLPTAPTSSDCHWVVLNWLAPTPIAPQTVAAFFLDTPREHSPPGLLSTRITVLRI